MVDQRQDFPDGFGKGMIVIADQVRNNTKRFLIAIIHLLRFVLVPTNGPDIITFPHVGQRILLLLKVGIRHIQKLLLQFGSFSDLILDSIDDVLFLDDAVIIDEVDFFLKLDDRQFLARNIEDKDAFDCLFQEIEEGVIGELEVVLVCNRGLLDERVVEEISGG